MSMTPPKLFVAGFAFPNSAPDRVYLIRKKKPDWQAGLLNGIGGKVEPCEAPAYAMAREFEEETGVKVPVDRWQRFAILDDIDARGLTRARVHFFKTTLLMGESPVTTTEEQVDLFKADPVPKDVIPNLKFLIPMARYDRLSFVHPAAIWERTF